MGRALDDVILGEIAKKHGKSVAQVIIRWHLQEGLIAIPKSTHRGWPAQVNGLAQTGLPLEDADDLVDLLNLQDVKRRTATSSRRP